MNHINLFNDLETHCDCILGVCVCLLFNAHVCYFA